jgi:hypothetical protein
MFRAVGQLGPNLLDNAVEIGHLKIAIRQRLQVAIRTVLVVARLQDAACSSRRCTAAPRVRMASTINSNSRSAILKTCFELICTSCGDRSASLERFFGGWSERALAQSEIFDVGTIAILLKTNTLLTFAGELSYLK